MSWAGRPLSAPVNKDFRNAFSRMADEVLREVHLLRVLHHDAEPRNFVFDNSSTNMMLVDFERSENVSRQPLPLLTTNSVSKRTKKAETRCLGRAFENEVIKLRGSMGSYSQ